MFPLWEKPTIARLNRLLHWMRLNPTAVDKDRYMMSSSLSQSTVTDIAIYRKRMCIIPLGRFKRNWVKHFCQRQVIKLGKRCSKVSTATGLQERAFFDF